MTRRAIVLTGCVAVLALWSGTTQAGGMSPWGFRANPEFRPTSAFGSPGGFPFKSVQDHRGPPPIHGRHLARRNFFFPAFPSYPLTTYAYAPSLPYASYPMDTASPTVNVSPEIYVAPTVYVTVPAAAPQLAPVAATAAPPPLPTVVEYPTGRYELRGDGVGVPYAWVWIPNPPSAPPASATTHEEPPPTTSASPSRSQVYRWTDEHGTEYWTNHPEKVPEPYRSSTQGLARIVSPQ